MALNLKYDILDNTRRAMCAQLAAWKNDFYLAGGTGLALQIGHRISEDFVAVYRHVASTTLDC